MPAQSIPVGICIPLNWTEINSTIYPASKQNEQKILHQRNEIKPYGPAFSYKLETVIGEEQKKKAAINHFQTAQKEAH